jgi:hypothetical protein
MSMLRTLRFSKGTPSFNKGDTMNVGKTNNIVQPVKPETTANDQKAKEAQQQRQAQAAAAQETQKTREALPEGTKAGEINITV